MLAHKDKTLNMLRLMAFGAVGVYIYNVYRKQGSLQGITGNPNQEISLNTDRVIDYVMPFVDLPSNYKQMISMGAKEAIRGYMQSRQAQKER